MNIKLARFIQDSYLLGSATATKLASDDGQFLDPRSVRLVPQVPRAVPNDPRVIARPINYMDPDSSAWRNKIVDSATNEGNAVLSQVMGTPVRMPPPFVRPAAAPIQTPDAPIVTQAPVAPSTSALDIPINLGSALGATAAIGGGYALYKYLQKKKLEKQLQEQAALEAYRNNMSFGDKALEVISSIDPSTIQSAIGAYRAITGGGMPQGPMYGGMPDQMYGGGGQYYA